MENYINIDKNMVVNSTIGDTEVVWRDVRQAPFALHGFYEPLTQPYFRRVPPDVAAATSEGVDKLSRESAGGRVRFSTDSPYIAIRAKYLVVGRSPHLTLLSSSGFDLYTEGEFGSRFVKEFRMPYDMVDSYEQILQVGEGGMRSYTVNFPVHAVVESLEIGLKPDASIGEAKPYRDIKPVVFYGSSITHGACASRPGRAYEAIISRKYDLNYTCLGFSGACKAEKAIVEYMATLQMSAFVSDYDHNAPTHEHLANTHHYLYETIREKHPNIPYFMVTRPNFYFNEDCIGRRDSGGNGSCRIVFITLVNVGKHAFKGAAFTLFYKLKISSSRSCLGRCHHKYLNLSIGKNYSTDVTAVHYNVVFSCYLSLCLKKEFSNLGNCGYG
jgi:hypothetical protein